MEYKEGDIVLCTVNEVTNTVTFVTLPDNSRGTIISSEIASGRIKFMRAYVVPNKKIVCKVLRISGNNIDLSLRRVTARERKDVMDNFKQEIATRTALKQALKENFPKVEQEITTDFGSLSNFIKAIKENKKNIEKYIPKNCIENIEKLTSKKQKEIEIKYLIKTKCLENDGINKIKKILEIKNPKIKITYISAGQFKLKLISDDIKTSKKEIQEFFEQLEKDAKQNHCELEYKEEK